ncbi:chloroplast RNA-binding protein 29 [Striga asiatica]|uniref:Chloroplast RNA-binding protein 29 n=1 Tax=Striga asiatica TaxID=4170 RepID=A0A5A7QPV6_STRAF|nr:chloroplast RNA-binding protein 29 [Striga asiatica]
MLNVGAAWAYGVGLKVGPRMADVKATKQERWTTGGATSCPFHGHRSFAAQPLSACTCISSAARYSTLPPSLTTSLSFYLHITNPRPTTRNTRRPPSYRRQTTMSTVRRSP